MMLARLMNVNPYKEIKNRLLEFKIGMYLILNDIIRICSISNAFNN